MLRFLPLLGALLAGHALAADKAPLSAETMWQLQRFSAPSLSPDGSQAVAAVTVFDMAKDKGLSQLWLFATDGSDERQLTSHASGASNPQFSPDGRLIAFTAQRDGDEASQIYLLPIAEGGEPRRLTEVPTGVTAIQWQGDGRAIGFISRVWGNLETWEQQAQRLKERKESKVSAQVWDAVPVTWWDQWIDERQAHVYRIGVDGGEPEALTRPSGRELPRATQDGGSYELSPDGRLLAFVSDNGDSPVRNNLDLFLLDIASGALSNLTEANPGPDGNPRFSPDGRQLAWVQQTIPGFYGDTRRLMLRDLRAGRTRAVAHDWDRSADGLVWAPDSRSLYGSIDDAGTRRLYQITLDGRPPRAITGARSYTSPAIAGSRRPVLVALRESFVEPPTLVRVSLDKGEASQISRRNDALMAAIDWGRYESVSYRGANDVEIQMWINYPPGFDPSRRYPILHLLHGGPHNGITDQFQWRWNAQLFAGWGYVTAWHNFHGSSGFGQDFTDSINPYQDDLPYRDTIKAAEWLLSQPWADRERIAAAGASYGGYLASILLGRDHPYKTIVAHAAVYNWYTQYAADYGGGNRRHGEFWTNPEIWKQSSPHYGAGNFNTPTLVIHGQRDYRVPMTHGLELFHTLQNRGVESRFIYYPDENHWILKPNNSLFWYSEVRRWVERFVRPGSGE